MALWFNPPWLYLRIDIGMRAVKSGKGMLFSRDHSLSFLQSWQRIVLESTPQPSQYPKARFSNEKSQPNIFYKLVRTTFTYRNNSFIILFILLIQLWRNFCSWSEFLLHFSANEPSVLWLMFFLDCFISKKELTSDLFGIHYGTEKMPFGFFQIFI